MLALAASLAACGGEEGGTTRRAPGASAQAQQETKGAALYRQGCVMCHGPGGAGTQLGPALSDRKREVDEVVRVVQAGAPDPAPPQVPMPARGDGAWSEAQVREAAEYVRSLGR